MSNTEPSTETMRGWAINGYGEPIVLMEGLPIPKPGPRDVLIKMRSAEVRDWDELAYRMNFRKIIQIVAMPDGSAALCEDGSLLYKTISGNAVMGVWQEIDAIPA